ncbi:unnamed protein product, partial [Closterium sp. NIES-53]
FYHPTLRRVLSSQDVTFGESVPYYRLFPYRTAPLPPPPLFLAPDAVKPVEVAVDSGAARGAEPAGAGSGGAVSRGAEPRGAELGGAEPGGAGSGGSEPGGAEPGGAERELLSLQELREWFARRWRRAAGAGGPNIATGPRGARTGGAGAVGTGGAAAAAGVGAAGVFGAAGTGAAGGVGAGVSTDAGTSEGAGVGAVGAGGSTGAGAAAVGTGAVPTGSGGPARPPYFVPLLEQVLGLQPSTGPAPPFECPQPVQSQSQLQPVSPLPAPSPYTGPTGGLAERRAPASHPASPVRTTHTSRRAPRPHPPAVPCTHQMALRPSTAPLRVPLPSPPKSSLPVLADPESDSLRAASPTVARLLSTVVTDPSLESTAASALVAELVDFAARCRLDYAASLVAESESVCPPSVGGECALSTDVLEDRQEEFQCFAAALPHLQLHVLLHLRPVYGLRQAPREWHDTLRTTLAALGFAPSTADPSLFLRTDTSLPLFYILVYVDDLVFATADTAGLAHVKLELQKRHTCTDVGPSALRLHVLLASGHSSVHSGMGLVLGGRRRVVLTGHADASWADDQATRRSSQGYTFSLGSGSVSWRSTRSSSVLGSSYEAEIYAGAMAAEELRLLTYLLTDLGEPPRSPPVLYVDNKAMLALCWEHRLEHRTKHIALRYFLARELQQRGQLRLAYVASEANTADIFTKALPPGDHQRFCTMLGLVPTWPHLLTS